MEGEENMIIKTKLSEAIYKFLNRNPIINLNLIGFMENEPEAEIYVDNEENPSGVIARKDYFSFLYVENDDFLNEALDTLYSGDNFYGFSGVYRPIADKIKSRYIVNWVSPCSLYYLPKKEVDLSLIKHPLQDVEMKDAETIDHFYTFRDETSLERIKKDLGNRPSSAVYVDGDIASWVLVHNDNSMGIMFTKEEYRGKGYAVDVTIDLADKILKSGRTPFLQIVEGNNMSPGLARKCGFVHEGDFSDWFGIISGTPKELIDMHEECDKKLLEAIGDGAGYFNQGTEPMYIIPLRINNSFKAPENFNLELADDEDKITAWCQTLAEGLGIPVEERIEFIEKIRAAVTSDKYEFKLFTGKAGDKALSTIAFLRLYDDVCGIYMTSTTKDAEDTIKMATLVGGLKKVLEHNMYLSYINSTEEALNFYKEAGFVREERCQTKMP